MRDLRDRHGARAARRIRSRPRTEVAAIRRRRSQYGERRSTGPHDRRPVAEAIARFSRFRATADMGTARLDLPAIPVAARTPTSRPTIGPTRFRACLRPAWLDVTTACAAHLPSDTEAHVIVADSAVPVSVSGRTGYAVSIRSVIMAPMPCSSAYSITVASGPTRTLRIRLLQTRPPGMSRKLG